VLCGTLVPLLPVAGPNSSQVTSTRRLSLVSLPCTMVLVTLAACSQAMGRLRLVPVPMDRLRLVPVDIDSLRLVPVDMAVQPQILWQRSSSSSRLPMEATLRLLVSAVEAGSPVVLVRRSNR
jgi:hypothetical protein